MIPSLSTISIIIGIICTLFLLFTTLNDLFKNILLIIIPEISISIIMVFLELPNIFLKKKTHNFKT
jgi:hypothetical protein